MRALALVALATLSHASSQAAGPFQVRRANSGQAVVTSGPVAVIATSPYDGEVSAVYDPASYYFGVYDASGNQMQIAVQRNPVTQGIRISFDDGDNQSAPVSATASEMSVAPATINADGLQAAVITVVPRDANGVSLGTGLSMTFDAGLLWPAHLSGPVVDLGDGSYRATAVSSIPGTGTVFASVEGVALSPLPTITATAVDPNASLRDLAILQLQGMLGPGGPFETLQANAGSGSPQAAAIAAAVARANEALLTLANDDPNRDDNVLKIDFDAILSELADVLSDPGALNALGMRDAMDDLVGIARLIAQWHLERATSTCGVCDSDNPFKVCHAEASIALADTMRAAVSPDWSGIVDEYAQAVEWSLQAVQYCY